MREPEAGRTIPVSAGIEPAYWRAATADGSDGLLHRRRRPLPFNVKIRTWKVEPKRDEALTSGAAGVLGTLGIATENGSYAYFVATGVLADNENGNEEKAEAGKANLYEWHDGETIFIAQLGTERNMTSMTGAGFYQHQRAPTTRARREELACRARWHDGAFYFASATDGL